MLSGAPRTNAIGKNLQNPFRLPLPFFSAPDREKLFKGAAAALDKAISIFQQHLSQVRDAPKITELLKKKKKKKKKEYLANTDESKGEYRLYLTWELSEQKGEKKFFSPIHKSIDDSKFEPLIDFHMPETAFKVFRAHVSRYPGCDAKNVVLTDTEKTERDIKGKSKSTITHVVISSEAVEAFHEGREKQLSASAKTAIRFYEERCEKFGAPKGFGHPNGFQRLETTMNSLWSGKLPNWRLTAEDAKTGDPDLPYTDTEFEQQQKEYMDGYYGEGYYGE